MGAMTAWTSDYLFDDNDNASEIGMSISATYANPPKMVDPEELSKAWNMSVEDVKKTLRVTTQRVNRIQDPTLTRHFPSNDRMLRYRRVNKDIFTDTFFATSKRVKSTRGNTCAQLFVTDSTYVHIYPMKKKSEVLTAIQNFAKEIGAPRSMICDPSRVQTK